MSDQALPVFSIKDVYKGASIHFVGDIITALTRFGLIGVFTYYLSPAEFGVLALTQVSIMLLVSVAPAGVPVAMMIRFRENRPDLMRKEKDTSFFILLFICAFISILFIAFFKNTLRNHGLLNAAPWMIVWAVSKIMCFIPSFSLRYRQKLVFYNIAKTTGVISTAVLVIFLTVLRGKGLTGIIIAEASGSFIELLLSLFFDRYIPSLPKKSFIPELLKTGFPICATALGLFIIELSDRYMVSFFIGKTAVGYYATAAKIVLIISFLVEAFNTVWTPYYYKMAGSKQTTPGSFYGVSRRTIAGFALVAATAMMLLPLFTKISFNGKYFIAPQYHVVQILIPPIVLLYFFKLAFYAATPPITFNRRNWRLSFIIYIAAISNILGNIFVIKIIQPGDLLLTLCGVSLMTSVSYVVCMVLSFKETFELVGRDDNTVREIIRASLFVASVLLLSFFIYQS